MKQHYFFVKGVVTFRQKGRKETYNKQGIFELNQRSDQSDKDFFLGLEDSLELEISRSLIKSNRQINQEDILNTRITFISHLN